MNKSKQQDSKVIRVPNALVPEVKRLIGLYRIEREKEKLENVVAPFVKQEVAA